MFFNKENLDVILNLSKSLDIQSFKKIIEEENFKV